MIQRRAGGVEDWRREVFRSARITDATRVLLLLMADRMDANRKVSVPRSELARLLGRREQRVAERFHSAVESGLLTTVSRGHKGRTAVYQGLFSIRTATAQRLHSVPARSMQTEALSIPIQSMQTIRQIGTQ